jgi:surfeit locus 1 family protein
VTLRVSSLPMLALTLAACVLFVALGRWQWQRGDYRTAQWQSFEREDGVRDADAATLGSLPRYTRVRLQGRFDGDHQFLLDNISEGGRVGYYVVTPLLTADGAAVLVNRGFVPGSGYRERLPDVAIAADAAPRTITARVGMLPVAGLASGSVPPSGTSSWPRVASFPSEADLAAALPYALTPGVLLLDDATDDGLLRHWQPPGLEPARHYAYAVQWWAFAVLALVLFVVLNLRKKRPS